MPKPKAMMAAPPIPLIRSKKRRRLETRDKTTVTSIAFPDDVHQQAMLVALRSNMSLNVLVVDAVKEWLARHAPHGGAR